MNDYREILRLKHLGRSQREIARDLYCSRNIVSDTLVAAKNMGIAWPLDEHITNTVLQGILFPDKYRSRSSDYLEPNYEHVHKELAKPGVTLIMLWQEYCNDATAAGERPYQETQFRTKYHKWARITNATMRLQHKPGDAMQVDWAGQALPIYDPDTGEAVDAYLFLAVLPYSGYAYVEACSDMKAENWILCHIHAYSYFGGVTRLLIPDNLKASVISNTRNGVVLNRSYLEMAEHYGTAVVPTRVRHPRDKSHVEGSVKIAYQKILAPLRNRKFFSLAEANRAIAEQLEVLNSTPFQKREGCRKSCYLLEEKDFMRPLPLAQYEPAIWSKAKVPSDYMVSDGKNKYSVPFDLIGEEVDLRLTKNSVEVFFKGSKVATHIRASKVLHDPVVIEEHMTPEHRRYLRYNADDFMLWAKSVGPMTEKVTSLFLEQEREPEQGFKACASLSRLGDRYGVERLENACNRMLSISSRPTVRNIASILKNGNNVKPPATEPRTPSTGGGITRGAAAFKIGGGK